MRSNLNLHAILPGVIDEMANKSRASIYKHDFLAWQADILGERTYEKMQHIGHDVLFSPRPRTMVKSCNGASKTYQSARWALWWITAFPPEESLAIMTAPTLRQVSAGVFMYLKSSYGQVKQAALAEKRPFPWVGSINEELEWKFDRPGGKELLALGRVPSPTDAVSTFQGIRKVGGRNFIVLDEAGGVAEQNFRAIESIMTSGDSRMVGIGNPDRRATEFHTRFSEESHANEHNLHTISAYDLPTLTGEIVYPDEPEKQDLMLRGLTSKAWVRHKERVWASGGTIEPDDEFPDDPRYARRVGNFKWDARGLAKVLGEFPGETDNAFFPQSAIDTAWDAEIDKPDAPVILGCDIARYGDDESVVYVNVGGKVRLFEDKIPFRNTNGDVLGETTGVWSKSSTVESARRIFAIAEHLGADEVRIDGSGIGGAVYDDLDDVERFEELPFLLIGINGGRKSRDKNRWANTRAEQHDNLRSLMVDGAVDLDPADTHLKDELLVVTYKFTPSGAIQITPKDDMKGAMGGSPDRMDAVIYAVADMEDITGNPYSELKPGDRVLMAPSEFYDTSELYSSSYGV